MTPSTKRLSSSKSRYSVTLTDKRIPRRRRKAVAYRPRRDRLNKSIILISVDQKVPYIGCGRYSDRSLIIEAIVRAVAT